MNGYDGKPLALGGRVQFHPNTSLWIQGCRGGTVVGLFRSEPNLPEQVNVRLDADAPVDAGKIASVRTSFVRGV